MTDWYDVLVAAGIALAGYAVGAGIHIIIAYRTAQKHVVLGVEKSRQSFLREVREQVLPEERGKIVEAVLASLPKVPSVAEITDSVVARFPGFEAMLDEAVADVQADTETKLNAIVPRLEQVVQAKLASFEAGKVRALDEAMARGAGGVPGQPDQGRVIAELIRARAPKKYQGLAFALLGQQAPPTNGSGGGNPLLALASPKPPSAGSGTLLIPKAADAAGSGSGA